VIVVEDTDCETDTVYVPSPPVAVPNAVIVVPAVTPDPVMTDPTPRTPVVTDAIVKVVPAILPVPLNPPPSVIGPVDIAFLVDGIV
jgi:hypothetical protein